MKSLFASTALAFAITAFTALPAAHAQDASTVTPPIAASDPADPGAAGPAQNVYNWQDVPAGMQVKIVRATFDQTGYQLYDDQGDTILVPFADQNLYVLRFGQTDGGMYFVSDGTAPSLFLPAGGYLSNAAVEGSNWYPFDSDYDYTAPVYEGPAPSYDDYADMAWYPGMNCYGGYCTTQPWIEGVVIGRMPGAYVSVGSDRIFGWSTYTDYAARHPFRRVYAPRPVAIVRNLASAQFQPKISYTPAVRQYQPSNGYPNHPTNPTFSVGSTARTTSPTYASGSVTRTSNPTYTGGYARSTAPAYTGGYAPRNANPGYGSGYPAQIANPGYGTPRYSPAPVSPNTSGRPYGGPTQPGVGRQSSTTGSSNGTNRSF